VEKTLLDFLGIRISGIRLISLNLRVVRT